MTMPRVIEMLAEMIEQARHEKKWFYCDYQGLWFSPDELEKHNANGRFLWGPINWQLRDPRERAEQLDHQIETLRRERDRIIAMLR
jgi:hypothetical protein